MSGGLLIGMDGGGTHSSAVAVRPDGGIPVLVRVHAHPVSLLGGMQAVQGGIVRNGGRHLFRRTGSGLFVSEQHAASLAAPLLTVDGTLSLSAASASFSNYTSLTMNVKHTYLEATSIIGDFSSVLLDTRRFRRIAEADSQKMLHFIPGMTIILK